MQTFICACLGSIWWICITGVVPSAQNRYFDVGNSSADPGFDLLFTSNLQEVGDVHIHFQNPLPSWLKGTLIRNGLGRFEFGPRHVKHAFDGFSKPCAWKFYGNGSVTFSTKFLYSDSYNASLAKDDIAPYLMFQGVEPPFNEVEKLEALVHGLDNMNVNVYDFYNSFENKSEYMAINDFWKIYQINLTNLATIGPINAQLPNNPGSKTLEFLSFLSSSHPLPEMGTSYHITFVSTVSLVPGIKGSITLVRIKSAFVREEIANWKVDKVPYMHSFSVTQHYAIFFASPFYINVLNMLRYAEPIDSLDWFPNEQTTVYVIELKTGKVRTMKAENVFCWHHINAYENEDGVIVLDLASPESPGFVKSLEMAALKDVHLRNKIIRRSTIKRYEIDVMAERVFSVRFVSSPGMEFVQELEMPTINENYRFRKYCYVYGVVLKSDHLHLSNVTVVKKDLCRPNKDRMWYVPYHYPVEAWFVPTPGGHEEDDGILITPVLDGPNRKSYLAIIDPKTMTTVNSATLPIVVPFTLHGRFFHNVI
ncbi:beta,beta-carotene 15,15'-dioxygenase-like [Liolophura sinensis]|uniref:beta,beta-carotene 15,15'-dioxygenase-like n=1 Tax=Liolophura sinensis TaxID=3198878 RepID=UPI003158CB90